MSVFYNGKLLRNIRKESYFLKNYSTGGVTETNLIGDLPGFSTVWYHPNGIANILSLSKVKKRYRVAYDSLDGNAFDVHLTDIRIRSFIETLNGICYSDMRAQASSSGSIFIITVKNNNLNIQKETIYARLTPANYKVL